MPDTMGVTMFRTIARSSSAAAPPAAREAPVSRRDRRAPVVACGLLAASPPAAREAPVSRRDRRAPVVACGLLAASLLALVAMPATAQSPDASPSVDPGASPRVAPTPAPTGSPGLLPPGSARIATTGDVEASIDIPQDPSSEFPTGDGSFDLVFKDAELNTLYVTLDLAEGMVTSAFVGVGVPGTSIVDDTYFADFFRSQCLVTLNQLDETAVAGEIACDDLENATSENPLSVDLHAEFSAVPELAPPSPSPAGAAAPDASATP
jgi:hypothetical protein